MTSPDGIYEATASPKSIAAWLRRERQAAEETAARIAWLEELLKRRLAEKAAAPRPSASAGTDSRLTDKQRSLVNSAAAHRRWAMEENRTAATQPARDGLTRKFEREVDPEGKLPPQELAKRVENARKAYYKTLSAKSAAARARRKGGQ